MDQAITENGVEEIQPLAAINDDHGGVIVEMKEHVDSNVFLTLLRASMSQWKLQDKKGIWIKLPIGLVHLVETAVKEGFSYHHAEPAYLMLVYWIPETESTIPANATHRIGIGAIVFNDKRELLVVQENSGKFWGTGVWKIPTGIVDEGEEIFAGAIREVKEETGVSVVTWQFHKSFFEKSDLFILCMLRQLSFDIQKQELEIEAAQDHAGKSSLNYTCLLDECLLCGSRSWIALGKLKDANHLTIPSHESGVISGPYPCVKCAIHCEYPCQSSPPSPPSAPIYGGQPPPPSPDPLYEVPPPPPPPSRPLYGVPPPPTGPLYRVTPPPDSQLPGGNYPPPPYLQCCTYSPPSTYGDMPYGSAAHLCLSLFSLLVSVFMLVIVY